MRVSSPLFPPIGTSARLFATGAVVGPIVDSLHNQCLLEYDFAPISLHVPQEVITSEATNYFFCSSYTIPPLLGIAYVILGGVLPRVFQIALDNSFLQSDANAPDAAATNSQQLKTKAIWAVATTAMIIKLSELLQTHPQLLSSAENNLAFMLSAAVAQWAILDGTLPALLAATLTSVGGPLSELPFVANGFWHYLPEAGDYLPLLNVGNDSNALGNAFQWALGENYRDLSLSSITGPCYFAVTMDAIAIGRWFDSSNREEK